MLVKFRPDSKYANPPQSDVARRRRQRHTPLQVESLEERILLADWSGDIANGTVWSSAEVQRIVGNVRVPPGATLTIQPGTVIKANTFPNLRLTVEGTLNAQGTNAQPILFTSFRDDTGLDGALGTADDRDTNGDGPSNGARGDWGGITFAPSSLSSRLDHVELRFGGQGFLNRALHVDRGEVTMTNSVIRGSGSTGIHIAAASPVFNNVSVLNSLNAAVTMSLDANPTFVGGTYSGNSVNGVFLDAGVLPGDATWDDADIPYMLSGDVTVPAGRTLTVGAGQVIKSFSNSGFIVTSNILVDGRLLSQGTADRPVVFTSQRDDSIAGDTNADGPSSGWVGDWGAIRFSATSVGNVLNHTEVRFGGGFFFQGAVQMDGGEVVMSGGGIRNSARAGFRVSSGMPQIRDVAFEGNLESAVSMSLSSNPAVSGGTYTGNGVNGVLVDAGSLSGDAAWDDPDVVYRLNGDVTVPVGATLTVAPGQVIKSFSLVHFIASSNLLVDGRLIADGTRDRPIIFTSRRDDSAGGDTNNDQDSSGAKGDWGGIRFSGTSTGNVLDHVEVRFAGGLGLAGAVQVNGGQLTLSNSLIRDSIEYGVRVTSARPSLADVAIEGSLQSAISMDPSSDLGCSGEVTASGNGTNAIVVDGGSIGADRSWTCGDLAYQLAGNVTVPAGTTLAVAAGTILDIPPNLSLLGSGTVANSGTIRKSTGTGTATIAPATINTGTIAVQAGTIHLSDSLANNGTGIVTGPVGTTIAISKNLNGDTRSAARFAPLATIQFRGSGTPAAPQLLEALSADKGNVGSGFDDNLAFYTISLTNNTYVKLVDNADNAPGGGAEAVYVNSLIVPGGTTLDLNGLRLYTRATQGTGTITGGSVTIMPDGGPLTVDTLTAGRISAAAEIDDWTFFGRAGQAVTITLATGAASPTPPITPTLNFAQLKLLDPAGNTLAMAHNTTSGQEVSLAGVALPADGTYHVKVQAAPVQPNNTGNYVLAAWNATINLAPLVLNETVHGEIDTPFRTDRWTFSGQAGQVFNFKIVAAEHGNIQFDLTGPNGFTAFSNQSSSRDGVTLPASGNYAVSVHTAQRQTGAYAFRLDSVTVTTLDLGTAFHGPIAGGRQSQLFKVNLTELRQLRITLSDTSASDRNELYVKHLSAPTRGDYQYKFATPASANQRVDVPAAPPGEWFILLYTEAAPNPGNITLLADASSVFLSGVTPDHAGTAADAVLKLAGMGFDNSTGVSLVSQTNAVFPATRVEHDLPTQLTVTFAAASVPAGVYSIRVNKSDGGTATLPGAFTFAQGGESRFEAKLIVPSALGYHIPGVLYLEYGNAGDLAMPAPLLIFTPTQTHANGETRPGAFLTLDQSLVTAGFWTSATPDGFSHSIQILANGGTPGVLQPGDKVRLPIYYAGWQQPWDFNYPPFQFGLKVIEADDPNPVDWAGLKQALPAPQIDPAAWDVIWSNLQAEMGNTWGSYISALNANAAYLGQLGIRVNDIGQLWGFELAQAQGLTLQPQLSASVDAAVQAPGLPLTFSRVYHGTLSGRYKLGPLGRGWTWNDGWLSVLTVDADGSVTIADPGGNQRRFQPDSRGGYLGLPGDAGVLSSAGGKFTVREPDGQVTGFRADRKIEFVQDRNGNKITATYSDGRLTRLTHSSGQTLDIGYNSAGRITTVVDDVGRSTQFTYDASNEHLLSVTDAGNLTTRYMYSLGNGPATEHALVSITHPDGTREIFGYDSRGRLNNTHYDNDLANVDYGFPGAGVVVATAAGGVTTTYSLDHRGLLAKFENPLGHSAFFTYDLNGNVTEFSDPGGRRHRYTYDRSGNLLESTDALGLTTRYTFDHSGLLTSVVDPKGNAIRYAYDARGNRASTTYADGTVETAAYDAIGNLTGVRNRRGQQIQFTYDTSGRPLSKRFEDGTQVDFVYDARGNLTSMTDTTGVTTLAYDPQDRLAQITYPSGRFLKYSYDDSGRRIKMEDQAGSAVNYSYNGAGQLASLSDAGGNILVTYTYDAHGQLQRVQNSNGSATTYDHDVTGRLTSVLNSDGGGQVTSRFEYAFDASGQTTGMTTSEGTWGYTYDGNGQLTRAVFTSANQAVIANQNLVYDYDAAGNRTGTVLNGTATDYVTNTLNQYASVGSIRYEYDADGNLIRKDDGGVLTTYSYDPENNLIQTTTSSGIQRYQYNGLGHLVAATQDGQATHYVVDPIGLDKVVAEYNAAGELVNRLVHGLGLVSRAEAAGASIYYQTDGTGNAVALTGAGGAVTAGFSYRPFGDLLRASNPTATDFQFAGAIGVRQSYGGLHFIRARFYDSSLGRFVEMDPSGTADGLNLYRYAGNNPLTFSDASGAVMSSAQVSTITRLLQLAEQRGGLGAVNILYRNLLQHGDVPLFIRQLRQALDYNGALRVARGITTAVPSTAQTLNAQLATAIRTGLSKVVIPGVTRTGYSALTRGIASGFVGRTIGQRVLGALFGTPAMLIRAGIGGFSVGSNYVRPVLENDRFFGIGKYVDAYDDWWYDKVESLGRAYDYFFGGDPVPNVASMDPNEKLGPNGFGPGGFVTGDSAFAYRVNYENDKEATAPAQRVTITDQLSSHLNWDTFEFTDFGFADTIVAATDGSQSYQTTVPMTFNGQLFDVRIRADFFSQTGQVTVVFQSIDPITELPPDVLTGFLPPEDGTGRGQGHFGFLIEPKRNLATGTQIRNIALITFDSNPPIATNQVDPHDPSKGTDPAKEALNTIDVGAPTSTVTALAAHSAPTFAVQWSGSDDAGGSGIASYDIFVSDNSGPFTLWMDDTTSSSAMFSGQHTHTYAFYSVATDNVGHVQPRPSQAQATTTVPADSEPPTLSNLPGDRTVTAPGPGGAVVTYNLPNATDNTDPAPTVACNPASGSTFPIGTTTVTCTARDAAGNSSMADFDVTVLPPDSTGPTLVSVIPSGRPGISLIQLTFSEPLQGTSADPNNFEIRAAGRDKKLGTADDTRIAIDEVMMLSPTTLLVFPLSPTAIKLNQFFSFTIFSSALAGVRAGVSDPAGNALDGNADGTAGDNLAVLAARGTKLTYVDRDGDTVALSLKTGAMTLVRSAASGEGERLFLSGTTSASILTGSVKKPKRGATGENGKTTLQSITGLGAGRNSLPAAQFVIPGGQVSARIVDAILESEEM